MMLNSVMPRLIRMECSVRASLMGYSYQELEALGEEKDGETRRMQDLLIDGIEGCHEQMRLLDQIREMRKEV